MNCYIDQITAQNYAKFDDMVYWRLHGVQRAPSAAQPGPAVVRELQNPNLHLYALGVGGIYVGWISLVYIPKVGRFGGHGHIYVDELWVQPAHRGKGYAKRLMQKADALCQALSAAGVRLYVNVQNPSAHRLYEACGFSESGTAVFMEK